MPTITLTKGYVAEVDDEDADLLANRYWATENGRNHVYAQRTRGGGPPYRKTYLHRDVAERMDGPIPAGFDVDHIDGDTLNCRRSNIRVVSHKANIWNQRQASKNSRSGVLGVRFRADRGTWSAYIVTGSKMRHLGTFATMEEARAARLAAERERELSVAA